MRLSGKGYREDIFKKALSCELRQSRMGRIVIRNLNEIMAAQPELHSEFKDVMGNRDYQEAFWASDLGYLWYEANFGAQNTYFEFAKKEITEKGYSSVLDVGCGWGEFCSQCAKLSNVTRVTGIDISEKIIKIAKEKSSGDKIRYSHSTINEESEPSDMITLFGSADYIPPTEFAGIVEKAIQLANREVIIVNSLRKLPIERALTLTEAVEVKRYDTGYVQPINTLLHKLHEKHKFNYKVEKYGRDSQMAVITK
jgi:SAM-dependent methyltransferase